MSFAQSSMLLRRSLLLILAAAAALLSSLAPYSALAQSANLPTGSLMVVNFDKPQNRILLAALEPIPAGAVISFTDKGWNSVDSKFMDGVWEGRSDWTVAQQIRPGSLLTLWLGNNGRIENITAGGSTALANVTGYSGSGANVDQSALENHGDQLFIYQGADNNPYFVFGFNMPHANNIDASIFWHVASGSITKFTLPRTQSHLPGPASGYGRQNALVDGVSALGIVTKWHNGWNANYDPNQHQVSAYNGPMTRASLTEWRSRILSKANWVGSDTAGFTGVVSNAAGASLPLTDALYPYVTNVTSSAVDGHQPLNSVLQIELSFSEAVSVTGVPRLSLNSGGTATYSGGSGTQTLLFNYTVAANQFTQDLDVSSNILLYGGAITSASASPAELNVPRGATVQGSLAFNKDISIDSQAPQLTLSPATQNAYIATVQPKVTLSFNKVVQGIDLVNISVNDTNLGSVSNLQQLSDKVWTVDFTPNANVRGEATISVVPAGISDIHGNVLTAAPSVKINVNTVRPTVAHLLLSTQRLKIGSTLTLDYRQEELLTCTCVSGPYLNVGAFSLFNLLGGGGWPPQVDFVQRATVTPVADQDYVKTKLRMDLSALVAYNGNRGEGELFSPEIEIDTLAPRVSVPARLSMHRNEIALLRSADGVSISIDEASKTTLLLTGQSADRLSLREVDQAQALGVTVVGNNSNSMTLTGDTAALNQLLTSLQLERTTGTATTVTVKAIDLLGNETSKTISVQLLNPKLVVTSASDAGADATIANTLNDDKNDGDGLSLREALHWVGAGEYIYFDLDPNASGAQGDVINLSAQLFIDKANLTIDGSLADGSRVTLSGGGSRAVISNYYPGVSGRTTLSHLIIRDGVDSFGAINSASPLLLDSVLMRDNGGDVSNGAISSSHDLEVRNSHFENNGTFNDGGAIYQHDQLQSAPKLVIVNSSFTGNYAKNGGAVAYRNWGEVRGRATIINSVFYDNRNTSQGQLGSAIAVMNNAELFMVNTTVMGNSSALQASAVYAAAGQMYNSVVVGNAVNDTRVSAGEVLAAGPYNDVGGDLSVMRNNYLGSLDLNAAPITDVGNTIDADLTDLYFSPLKTASDGRVYVGLLPNSALRNAGHSGSLPADTLDLDRDGNTYEALPLDFLGDSRVAETSVDIGAVEFYPEYEVDQLTTVLNYTERQPAVSVAPQLAVSSVYYDQANHGEGDYRGLLVNIALDDTDDGELQLQLPEQFVQEGERISLNIVQIATVMQADKTISIHFSSDVTISRTTVNAVLRSVMFGAGDARDLKAQASVNWQFVGSLQQLEWQTPITILPVNDAPLVSMNALNVEFVEAQSAVSLFTSTSVDAVEANQQLIRMQFIVSGVLDGANEKLNLFGNSIPLLANSSGGFTNGSGSYLVQTVTGGLRVQISGNWSAATVNDVLNAASYQNNKILPSAGVRQLSLVQLQDSGGTANGGVDTVELMFTSNIDVKPYNRTPEISGVPSASVNQNSPYYFVPQASDLENSPLLFIVENLPVWLSFDNASGALSGTPTQQDVGIYSNIVISVSDGELSASLPAFAIEVVDINIAPVITGAPMTQIEQEQTYQFAPSATDDDGDTLSFSALNLPNWLSIDSESGVVSGTPQQADVGVYSNIVIRVSDGTVTSSLAAFAITVLDVNVAPVIQGVPASNVVADTAYTFSPTAADADGDNLVFSATNLPDWLSINEQTGVVSGVPTMDDLGRYEGIVIRVSDGELSASLPAFNVTVRVPAFALDQFDLVGLNKAERLGSALTFADRDDDHYPDVLVAAPQRAVTLNGKLAKNVGSIDVINVAKDSVQRNAFTGAIKNQRFASSMAIVADQDGDDITDLVIGKSHAGKFGEVALYSGANGALIRMLLSAEKALPVVDSQVDLKGRFGEVLAVADVDQDGIDDLIIGMPNSVSKTPAKLAKAGAVVVFDGLSSEVKYVRFGSTKTELFGAALSVDTQASQLLVGSPQYSPMLNGKKIAKAGRVQLFATNDGTSSAIGEVVGSVKNQLLGDAVASFEQDINGDGLNDWAVAQPSHKTAAQVQIYSGLNSQPFADQQVNAPFKRNAIRLASGADVNADGVNDLAIGLPLSTVEQPQPNGKLKKLKQAGAVLLVSGDSFSQ